MKTARHATLATLLTALLAGCGTSAVKHTAPEAESLTRCEVTLATARDNLTRRGYAIATETADAFTTAYKPSAADSETFMLGTPYIDRERRYTVSTDGAQAVRFLPGYRETEHTHPTATLVTRTVRERAPALDLDFIPVLKDMRAEVCDAPVAAPSAGAQPGVAPLDRRTWDYLLDRCKAGDESACDLLRPR